MKRSILVIALTSLFILSCSEEEVAPTQPVVETPVVEPPVVVPPVVVEPLKQIASITVSGSNGSDNIATYKFHYNSGGRVESIIYTLNEWDSPSVSTVTWSSDLNNITFDKIQTGVSREFYFNSDSSLVKMITIDDSGESLIRTFSMDGRVNSIIDVYSDATWTHKINYTNDLFLGIDYYCSPAYCDEPAITSQFTAVVEDYTNPVHSITPEILAFLVEYEMNEAWLISEKKIVKTGWEEYQNWDISYSYDEDGNLTEIVRTGNSDLSKDSNITITYN